MKSLARYQQLTLSISACSSNLALARYSTPVSLPAGVRVPDSNPEFAVLRTSRPMMDRPPT
jgi:hypothetical protein